MGVVLGEIMKTVILLAKMKAITENGQCKKRLG